ncbi:MAG: hypothetical protein HYX68_22470 [Planctomycetes bacterium]|jgi:hypothetical protein|nr:hypothetical protein [Planctomycetota bacterium]
MKPRSSLNVERLEDRDQPSTITLDANNNIVYTAGQGVANSVAVNPSLMNQGELVITETAENITSVPMGWTLSPDNRTATGPFNANSFVEFDVGDQGDYVNATMSPVWVKIWGKEGNDTLYGSQYSDRMFGGDG